MGTLINPFQRSHFRGLSVNLYRALRPLTTAMAMAAFVAPTLSTAGLISIPINQGKASGAFRLQSEGSFKGVSQVVLGQFTVVYLTKKVDYDGGGFMATSDVGKATGFLTGLSDTDYQKTTDAIFADFKTQMAAHGISFVDPAGLHANKYYAKVKPEVQGSKVDVVQKKDDHASGVAYFPTQLGHTDNALLAFRMFDTNPANTYTAQYDYARTAQVPVLNVVYYVDFAKPAQSEAGGLLASIKVKAGLAMSQFGTQIALMDTKGKMARINLATPIEEGGDFATITETTSGVTRAVQAASVVNNIFGVVGRRGGGALTMSAKFDYKVTDPAAYGEKALAAAIKLSDLYARQLEGLR